MKNNHRLARRLLIWVGTALLPVPTALADSDLVAAYLTAGVEQLAATTAALPEPTAASWFENPELRLTPEVDTRNLWTQTYSLRVRPTNAAERRLTRSLSAIDNELVQLEFRQSRNQLLAARYDQLLDLAALELEWALTQQHKLLDEAELSTQRALSSRAGYNATRLQQAALELELREAQLQHQTMQLQSLRSATVGSQFAVAADGAQPAALSARLLSPAQISQRLTRAPEHIAVEPAYRLLTVNRAEEEMSLTRAQRGFGLSLMEMAFENKGVDSYHITVGVRLPGGRSSPELARRARAVIRAERDAHVAQQWANSQDQNLLVVMQQLQSQYDLGHAALINSQARRQSGTLDAPAAQIQLRHELKLTESMAAAHVAMARQLVDALARWGRLDESPISNWLGATP